MIETMDLPFSSLRHSFLWEARTKFHRNWRIWFNLKMFCFELISGHLTLKVFFDSILVDFDSLFFTPIIAGYSFLANNNFAMFLYHKSSKCATENANLFHDAFVTSEPRVLARPGAFVSRLFHRYSIYSVNTTNDNNLTSSDFVSNLISF